MFFLRRLFGRGDDVYELLAASAQEGLTSVENLAAMLKKDTPIPSFDELSASRRKDKVLHEKIREVLARTHNSDMDRQETEALANALYKVPKTMEKFAERYVACASRCKGVTFARELAMLDEATRIVLKMLLDLKKSHFGTVKDQNARLQKIEGDADKLMLERLRELYGGNQQPVTTIAVRDLYEVLEKAFDHCRDAGNMVSQLVLKYS